MKWLQELLERYDTLEISTEELVGELRSRAEDIGFGGPGDEDGEEVQEAWANLSRAEREEITRDVLGDMAYDEEKGK